MKVRRDRLDIIFSKLVRERADWHCENCGKYFPEGTRQGLHCSHLWSRRNRSIRWEPKAAVAHCFSCHQLLGENPVLFRDWIMAHLGPREFARLQIQANTPRKWTRGEKEDLYQDMKATYERMLSERRAGVTGPLEWAA